MTGKSALAPSAALVPGAHVLRLQRLDLASLRESPRFKALMQQLE